MSHTKALELGLIDQAMFDYLDALKRSGHEDEYNQLEEELGITDDEIRDYEASLEDGTDLTEEKLKELERAAFGTRPAGTQFRTKKTRKGKKTSYPIFGNEPII